MFTYKLIFNKLLMIKTIRHLLFFLLLCLGFCLIENTFAQKNNSRLKFRIGFLNTDNPEKVKDYEAAAKTWYQFILKRFDKTKYQDVELITNFSKDLNQFSIESIDKKYDLIVLNGENFFKLKNYFDYTPALSGEKINNSFSKLLLLGIEETSIKNLTKNGNIEISLPESPQKSGAKMWATNLISDSCKLSNKNKVKFSNTEVNENKAILSLFFNKTKYTIVKEDAYNVACTLNPQIRNKVKVIAKSPNFLMSVFAAVRKDMDKELEFNFYKAAQEMHSNKQGQQILALFRSENMMRIYPKDFEELTKIATKYHKLDKRFFE